MEKRARYYWLFGAILAVLVLAGLFFGCGGGGGGSQPVAVTGTAVISVQLVDAQNDALLSPESGGPAGGVDVTFSVSGTPLGATINTKSGVVEYTTPNLTVGTVVNVEAVPINAAGNVDPNFLRNNLTVTINDQGANDYTNQKIRITNLNNLPADVTLATGTSTSDVSGTVETSVVVTPPASSAGASASVTIPAGAKLNAKNGQPLTGALTVNVVYYPSTSANAVQNFPGGLDNVVQTSGASGAFITGGFLAVEIVDSSGNFTRDISGPPLEITMEIPLGMMNPDTGAPVKAGDKVPVWSYSSKDGTWKSEGEKVVEAGGATGLQVRYTVSHLSYWNLDWLASSTCKGEISFTGNTVSLEVRIYGNQGSSFFASQNQPADDATAKVRNVPGAMPLIVDAYADGALVGSVSTNDWCAEPNKTITLAVTIPQPTSRSVTARYLCTRDNTTSMAASGINIMSCTETGSAMFANCDSVGSTDGNGQLTYSATNASKISVAAFKGDLYKAVNNIATLPNDEACPATGATGGTGGSGTGSNF